jgi:hypothetical protein
MKARRKMSLILTIAMITTLFTFYDGNETHAALTQINGVAVQDNLQFCTEMPESLIKGVNITKVAQLTGQQSMNKTEVPYDVAGTDLGSVFQMNDKMYYVFGDTFGAGSKFPPGTGTTFNWRSNVVGYSTDMDPTDGIMLDGFLQNAEGKAREIIPAKKIQGDHLTSIPTNGVAVKGKMYLYYMAVDTWAAPGGWATAFAGVYSSSDEGENWGPAEGLKWGPDSNFTQVAIVKPEQNRQVLNNDIYFYGVGAGRLNPVTLMKVNQNHIEDISKYFYFSGTDQKGNPQWSSEESEAKSVLETTAGELSVVWNEGLDRWIMTYFNGKTANIDVAEAENPWGPWTAPNTLVLQSDFPGLYGSYMDPAFILDDGKAIYFIMSQWGPYNTFVMKAELELKDENISNVCSSLHADKEMVPAGDQFQLEATIQNTSKDRYTDVAVELDLPEGWEVENLTPNQTKQINPNHQFHAIFQVSVPITDIEQRAVLKGKVTFQRDNNQVEIPLEETIYVKPVLEIVTTSVYPKLIASGESTTINVTLHNNRNTSTIGELSLEAPDGWNIPVQSFEISGKQNKDFTFTVESPDDYAGLANLVVSAWVENNAVATQTLPVGVGGAFLSDLNWMNATNGWGPVERDMSVGGKEEGDGNPLTLNGVVYKKGLGTHSHSEIIYNLSSKAARFTSDIGVDDGAAIGTPGQITFEVWGDGAKLYDSGLMKPESDTKSIDIDIEGIEQLKLIVTDGGNARSFDHGDWGNAWITYIPDAEPIDVIPGVEIVSATVDKDVIERGESATMHVTLHNKRYTSTMGELSLEAPEGWIIPQQSFELAGEESKDFTFTIDPPDDYAGLANVVVAATVGDKTIATRKLFIGVGGAYLSDLDWMSAINGWGPVERDMSVGGLEEGDGKPLTLNGVVYKKGLGTHSHSEIIYNLNGEAARFTADVGVDDTAALGTSAQIVFEVWGDGVKLYDSGLMWASTITKSINLDVSAMQQLKLIVTDGGNARSYDYGDWANAWITYTP